MREQLETLLLENVWNITEAVINEIIEDENPLETLMYFQEYGVEWGLVECLAFEKDSVKFFNKHYEEIEELRVYLHSLWVDLTIPSGYSTKAFFSALAFKHIAFDLYMQFIIEDL